MQHSEAVHSASRVVLSTLIEAADRDYRLYVLSDGTEDPDQQARDVLLGRIFPRRAQVIDTATLRGLLSP
jgi:nicotinamidase-related amidase